MGMIELFRKKHSFILLLAPPASGKTSFLLKLERDYRDRGYEWVFVSPLRALAEEFETRVHQHSSSMKVFTAEKLLNKCYEGFFEDEKALFVLDEFHLIYFWGLSFREKLWEFWMKLSVSKARVLGLTATYPRELEREVLGDIARNYSQFYKIDCGNLVFKNPPEKKVWLPSWAKKSWRDFIELEIRSLRGTERRVLLFTSYRKSVDYWLKVGENSGVLSLGCKGGEVQEFCEKLALGFDKVQFIVSTSCLSHGVNLPAFDRILIDHEVNLSMWVQMAARGGRRGENFDLISCKKKKGGAFVISFMVFIFYHLRNRMYLWFLKEFSFGNNPTKKGI